MNQNPKYVKVVLPVYFEDEDIPYDFPLRDDEVWEAVIDIRSGQIQNWPKQPDLDEFYI